MVVGQQFLTSFLAMAGRPWGVAGRPVGWPAGHLQEKCLAGQLSAFEPFTAVQLLFKISLSSGGYFGRESLGAFPSPFTPFLAYLRGWTAPSLGLQKFISRASLPLPPFSPPKTLKSFKSLALFFINPKPHHHHLHFSSKGVFSRG